MLIDATLLMIALAFRALLRAVIDMIYEAMICRHITVVTSPNGCRRHSGLRVPFTSAP